MSAQSVFNGGSGFFAGYLDRRVTILARSDTVDPNYGTRQATWAELATVSAQVIESAPSRGDRLSQDVALSDLPAIVRIRWRSDVSFANRLRLDGNEMRIVGGPAMIGRRVGLEIMAVRISTEGQQP